MLRLEAGNVSPEEEHFQLAYGDVQTQSPGEWIPVARVAVPEGEAIRMEFLLDESRREDAPICETARAQVQYFLITKGESDPWKYAIYHCGTSANVYSEIHWSYHPSSKPT